MLKGYKLIVWCALLLLLSCKKGESQNDLITIQLLSAITRSMIRESQAHFPISNAKAVTIFSDYYMITNNLSVKKLAYAQNKQFNKDLIAPFFAEIAFEDQYRHRHIHYDNTPGIILKCWGIGPGRMWKDANKLWLIVAQPLPEDQIVIIANTLGNISYGFGFCYDPDLNLAQVEYKCINPFNVYEGNFLDFLGQRKCSDNSAVYLLIGNGYFVGERIGRHVLDSNSYKKNIEWLKSEGYLCELIQILDKEDRFIFRCSRN